MNDPILATRDRSTQHMMKMLKPNVNLTEPMLSLSTKFHHFAVDLASGLPDGPELTTALRKLLESKDCAVRALVFHLNPNANE